METQEQRLNFERAVVHYRDTVSRQPVTPMHLSSDS